FQVRRVAFLEPKVRQAPRLGAFVSRLDQVAGDVDAEDVAAERRRGKRRRSVAAAEVEDLHATADAELADERRAASTHARGDAREVALLPQCLIRVHYVLRIHRTRAATGATVAPSGASRRVLGISIGTRRRYSAYSGWNVTRSRSSSWIAIRMYVVVARAKRRCVAVIVGVDQNAKNQPT